MIDFAELDKQSNGEYLKLLSAVSKLSGLFSDSAVPLINYRVAENIFCRSFAAENLSRSDTAFDAKYDDKGIGLKTFTCPNNYSTEKVAEFNSLSKELRKYAGKNLAVKLAEFRNERIDLANRTYDIKDSLYHIVARREKELLLFETDYSNIDIKKIKNVKEKPAGLTFEDGKHLYSFNYSKSTLYRKFDLPETAFKIPVEIIEDPYKLLLELFEDKILVADKDKLKRGIDYVILPLYGIAKKERFVYEKSGLNQWNAGGRKRNSGEIYIPIPIRIHIDFPNFFPPRDEKFNLSVPTNEIFSAKVCQDNSKALMTDPNKALSDWLLRKVLQLVPGKLATIEILDELGFDSVLITKTDNNNFKIDIMATGSYEKFINNEDLVL